MNESDPASQQTLKTTVLHDMHLANGARMVPFAGYDMPVQYPLGVLKEHQHTRTAAGLFDVSHMGQIMIRPKSGHVGDAAMALEALVPADIVGMKPGRQRYTFFTNDAGGLSDDLMLAHRGDHLFLVVNAACKQADEGHLRQHLADKCEIDLLDRALLALQGPQAETALATLWPGCSDMRFMDVRSAEILGADMTVTRSGYTGEDGFEISAPKTVAPDFAQALVSRDTVELIGLGARDSLRLEAGLCLYGADIDAETTPAEAALSWAIPKVRRIGGERAGAFPGAERILQELENGPNRMRVGLRAQGRAPVRAQAPLYETEAGGEPVGQVTSGGFGPSVGGPVAMGYVPTEHASPGTKLHAEVRGKRLPLAVTHLPFVAHGYRRTNNPSH